MQAPGVYAFANQKGGVGKTTTTLNIAAAIADSGRRVLVIDCDPQASATTAAGFDGDEFATLADVYDGDAPLNRAVRQTGWGFDLVPAELALARRESQRDIGGEYKLREALDDPGLEPYDVILLDCPPSLGMMTYNALTAARHLVIVTEAARFSLRGMDDMLDTVNAVRRYFNPDLAIAGVIVNMVDGTNVTRQRLGEIEDFFSGQVWEPHIPRGVAAKESTEKGVPLSQIKAHRVDEFVTIYKQLAARVGETTNHAS